MLVKRQLIIAVPVNSAEHTVAVMQICKNEGNEFKL